jgi:integrase
MRLSELFAVSLSKMFSVAEAIFAIELLTLAPFLRQWVSNGESVMAQIRKRRVGQYQARVRIVGSPEISKTFTSRQEAVAWATQTEQLVSRGFADSIRSADNLTLYDALDRYLSEVTPSKKGAQQERALILRWQKRPLTSLAVSRVKGSDLAQYRDIRLMEGVGANTIRIELALISHLYEVARKDWGLETLRNPAKAVRKPKPPRGRDRRLNCGEEEKLLAYCSTTGPAYLKVAIILAVETAMRRGEVASLYWDDVDLAARMIYLNDTKNGEARQVPLSMLATKTLQSVNKEPGQPILPVHPDNISAAFAAACKACDIHGLRLHDLRHEATSRLFEKGFNVMEVSTITGHKSLSMLKRYTHLKAKDLLCRLG